MNCAWTARRAATGERMSGLVITRRQPAGLHRDRPAGRHRRGSVGRDHLQSRTRRAREIVLKAEHIGPRQAILTATRTNAELFGLADRIGTVEEGKEADLILVAGDPSKT